MIKRILVGSLVGGIVLFLWGCAAWMFLPAYTDFKGIADEEAVVRTLSESLPEKGVYYFPKHPELSPSSVVQWNRKVSIGPTGIIVFNPTGHGSLGWRKFGISFLTQWAVALIAACMLSWTLAGRPRFRDRWFFVFLIGLVISLAAYFPNWNLYGYPTKYTCHLISDMVLGWALAGVFLAYFIKTEEEEKKEMKREEEIKKEIKTKLHKK